MASETAGTSSAKVLLPTIYDDIALLRREMQIMHHDAENSHILRERVYATLQYAWEARSVLWALGRVSKIYRASRLVRGSGKITRARE